MLKTSRQTENKARKFSPYIIFINLKEKSGFMKLEKIKNLVLGVGKWLSIFSIVVIIISTVIVIRLELGSHFHLEDWLNEIITSCLEIVIFYGSVFVLPGLFGFGAILTGIIAFKNRNMKEFLDLRFLIILAGIFLPFGFLFLP